MSSTKKDKPCFRCKKPCHGYMCKKCTTMKRHPTSSSLSRYNRKKREREKKKKNV